MCKTAIPLDGATLKDAFEIAITLREQGRPDSIFCKSGKLYTTDVSIALAWEFDEYSGFSNESNEDIKKPFKISSGPNLSKATLVFGGYRPGISGKKAGLKPKGYTGEGFPVFCFFKIGILKGFFYYLENGDIKN